MSRPTVSGPMSSLTTGGFTLVELLIVMALIGILVVALLPNVLSGKEQGKMAETKMRLNHLRTCIETYDRKRGYYPPSSFADADKRVKVKNNTTNESIVNVVLLQRSKEQEELFKIHMVSPLEFSPAATV